MFWVKLSKEITNVAHQPKNHIKSNFRPVVNCNSLGFLQFRRFEFDGENKEFSD